MLFSLKAVTALTLANAVLANNNNDNQECNENTEPTQIRLAYAGDHGMSVSWNTKQKLSKPTVNFGIGSNLERSALSDISIIYPSSSTYNNHVTITGLAPDTRYHYRPQCSNRGYSFMTARSISDGESFKFAMVGDMGTIGLDGLSTTVGKGAMNPLKPGENTSIDSLYSLKTSFDFIWHSPSSIPIFFHLLTVIASDIAYADAWLKEEKGGYVKPLNTTNNGVEYDKILRDVPYMVRLGEFTTSKLDKSLTSKGNHEANCDNGADLSICVPGQLNFTGYYAH